MTLVVDGAFMMGVRDLARSLLEEQAGKGHCHQPDNIGNKVASALYKQVPLSCFLQTAACKAYRGKAHISSRGRTSSRLLLGRMLYSS